MTSPTSIVPPCICGDSACTIPFGLCHCGCEMETSVFKKTNSKSGQKKGDRAKFITGHNLVVAPISEEAKAFKMDGVYCRIIPLSQGQFAIVWEEDYWWLTKWRWNAKWNPEMGGFYAGRGALVNGRWRTIWMHR